MERTRSLARAEKSARKPSAAPKRARNSKPQSTVEPSSGSPAVSVKSQNERPSGGKPVGTKVIADIDVGFGNAIYIRGDGPGLSWEKGVPLQCVDHRTWMWETNSANREFSFKLLLNDSRWSRGDNAMAIPGQTVCLCPAFD